MVSKKRIKEQLRLYYKGPLRSPARVADERAMEIISRALTDCAPLRSKRAFKCRWRGESTHVKLVIGLSAALRHLKHKRTLALVFDDTADHTLANLLVEFANKLDIPIVQARKLINLAPSLGLKTLLVFSLVKAESNEEVSSLDDASDSQSPANTTLENESFDQLVSLLQGETMVNIVNTPTRDKYTFKLPHLEQLKSAGKSKAKKEARAKVKKDKQRLQRPSKS